MKFRDYDELWRSDKENVFMFYSRGDLGAKYKLYRNVSYGKRISLEYINSFTTYGEALTYAKKIHDILIKR